MQDISINVWAVLVAALANMVIGSLWYGPLFGKAWKKMMGFSDQSMKSMKMTAMQAMVGGLVTAFLMAFVLGHFADVWGVMSVGGAWELAFWVWLGFVATTQLGSVLWEGKSFKLFVLNTAQSLASLFAMAVILALWK
jgi:hypothetical protein